MNVTLRVSDCRGRTQPLNQGSNFDLLLDVQMKRWSDYSLGRSFSQTHTYASKPVHTSVGSTSGSLSLSVLPLKRHQNAADVKAMYVLFILLYEGCLLHTHTECVRLALCVSNQTNRLRRREVRTLGGMDTKSAGDNMVSVLWINDCFLGLTPSQPGNWGGAWLAAAMGSVSWRGVWKPVGWGGGDCEWQRQV